jgi:sugar lactone lactonase YvrE
VIVDSAGNLYIADSANNRIREISGGVINTVAGNGTPGFSGEGGPATSAQLYAPSGVAVDTAGNLYISDTYSGSIRKVSNGVITTVAGNGTPGFSGDNGPATVAQLNSPYGLAVDTAGNLYIADTGNQRIRRVSSGGAIATVAGNGTPGFSGDGGAAIAAQLDNPHDLYGLPRHGAGGSVRRQFDGRNQNYRGLFLDGRRPAGLDHRFRRILRYRFRLRHFGGRPQLRPIP